MLLHLCFLEADQIRLQIDKMRELLLGETMR